MGSRRSYWQPVPLIVLALLSVGWVRTAPVVGVSTGVQALAIDGGTLAWADCERVVVLSGARRTTVLLPSILQDMDCDEAQLVLAGRNIGWVYADDSGNSESVAVGVISLRPHAAARLWLESYAIDPPWEGLGWGGLAADGTHIVWAHTSVSFLGPSANDCDYGPGQAPPCTEEVTGGEIHTWSAGSDGSSTLPPAATLAANRGWVAVAVLPLGTWLQTQIHPPRTIEVLRETDGSVVAQVPSHGAVQALAVSHRLLAVEQGNWVRLYRLPSGHLLRRVHWPSLAVIPRYNTGWIAVSGDTLVLWSATHVVTVDAATGQNRTLARLRPDGKDGTISAVATDDTRIAWATMLGARKSVIRVLRLR